MNPFSLCVSSPTALCSSQISCLFLTSCLLLPLSPELKYLIVPGRLGRSKGMWNGKSLHNPQTASQPTPSVLEMKKLSCKELYLLPHLMHYEQKQKSTHPFLINPDKWAGKGSLECYPPPYKQMMDFLSKEKITEFALGSSYPPPALLMNIYLKPLMCP